MFQTPFNHVSVTIQIFFSRLNSRKNRSPIMFQTPFNHVLDTIQSVMFQLPFSNSWEGDIDEGLGVNGPPIATVTRAAETSLAGAEGLIIANSSCFEFYCVEVLHK